MLVSIWTHLELLSICRHCLFTSSHPVPFYLILVELHVQIDLSYRDAGKGWFDLAIVIASEGTK